MDVCDAMQYWRPLTQAPVNEDGIPGSLILHPDDAEFYVGLPTIVEQSVLEFYDEFNAGPTALRYGSRGVYLTPPADVLRSGEWDMFNRNGNNRGRVSMDGAREIFYPHDYRQWWCDTHDGWYYAGWGEFIRRGSKAERHFDTNYTYCRRLQEDAMETPAQQMTRNMTSPEPRAPVKADKPCAYERACMDAVASVMATIDTNSGDEYELEILPTPPPVERCLFGSDEH